MVTVNTVKQILERKGAEVFTVEATASALDAARLMNEHGIGALVVLERGHVGGIVTERDILRQVVATARHPAACPVSEIMTCAVICARLDTPIKEACATFTHRRIRHLPVVDDHGALRGIVSIGDVNAWEASEHEREIHYLHEYIHGRV